MSIRFQMTHGKNLKGQMEIIYDVLESNRVGLKDTRVFVFRIIYDPDLITLDELITELERISNLENNISIYSNKKEVIEK